jgi:hypothetical protein
MEKRRVLAPGDINILRRTTPSDAIFKPLTLSSQSSSNNAEIGGTGLRREASQNAKYPTAGATTLASPPLPVVAKKP